MKPPRCPRVLLLGALLVVPMPGQTDTRAIMNDAFDAIAYLLPLSLLEMQGKANRDQELVARKLDVLERAASTLATHGGAHDTEFTLLSRAFDRAIPSVRRAFDERYPAFAWYALMSLTQHCSACHSRLPDERDYGFGQRLLARMDMDALEAAERARLLVATRQFERALGEYERALLDPGHRPEDADLDGLYVDYLNLSITVAQDFERPRVLLRRLLERTDLPYYLRHRFHVWLEAMELLDGELRIRPTLEHARRLFDTATAMSAAPAGRERAVHDLTAASLLRRLLDGGGLGKTDRAHAYHLLGIISLRSTEIEPAVPEMELLFEAAIRTAPGSPIAAAAYAMLEEYGFVDDLPLSGEAYTTPLLDLPELRELALE